MVLLSDWIPWWTSNVTIYWFLPHLEFKTTHMETKIQNLSLICATSKIIHITSVNDVYKPSKISHVK